MLELLSSTDHSPPPASDPYLLRLSRPQHSVFADPSRFRVVVAGRRFGKTVLALAFLLERALDGDDKTCWYIAPTYKQAKRVAWRLLKRLIPRAYVHGKPNETDLTVTLINGSVIALMGADNPDSLRGVGLDAVAFDEYAQMDPRTWPEIVRPMLSVSQGPAMFIGTPRGYNHFHELYVKGLQGAEFDDASGMLDTWASFEFKSVEGGWISAAEIEAARRTLDARTFRQEYEASFETMAGRVYDAFDRKFNVDPLIEWPRHGDAIILPVKVGIDFNVNPGMHAVLGFRLPHRLNIVDEIFIPRGTTAQLALTVRERWPGAPVYHAMPDPTGNAASTKTADVTITDLTILRDHDFEVYAPPGSYAIVDKINTTNAAFCNALGERRAFVHPRCRLTIKSLEGLVFKEQTGIIDKSSGLDHMADAMAYLTCWEFPLVPRITANQELPL